MKIQRRRVHTVFTSSILSSLLILLSLLNIGCGRIWGSVVNSSYQKTSYLFVTDTNGNRIQKFDLQGNFINQIGCPTGACTSGSANGQFYLPGQVIFDSAGHMWVDDSGNGRIQEFDSNGNYLGQFGNPGTGVGQLNVNGTGVGSGLAFDASGNFWVADYNSGLQKFSPTGNYLTEVGTYGAGNNQFNAGILSVMVDPFSNLWVSVDLSGSGNNAVLEFNSSGTYVQTISGTPTIADPCQITTDALGNIWVGNFGPTGFPLTEFNASGAFVATYGSWGNGNGQFSAGFGLAFDADGNLWTSDWNLNRIQKFDKNFNYVMQFGSGGTGNGQFNSPSFLTITQQ